ncbi:MAG: beta-1,6-N-acetylglucosaminyltransferase [Pseudomonadota bacterium]
MTVGFALLTHDQPRVVADLARHLTYQGAPVMLHLDRRATGGPELERALDGAAEVISTQASEWGMFGLVQATLDLAAALLARHPEVSHVFLLSGACLPLRPVSALQAFLAAHPETDFIEAEPPEAWVGGGLDHERFTLHHLFPWKRRRWLFDRWVEVQRSLGVSRRMPAGLAPRTGRQWWCLRRATLERILADPQLPGWQRFFRSVWIPDESFFQTIVHSYGLQSDPRPLTLTRFDRFGNPLVFHDDHIPLLAKAPNFFARKADPEAHALRAWAFSDAATGEASDETRLDETEIAAAFLEREGEHFGLQMAGRYPRGAGVLNPGTARPYTVLISDDAEILSRLRTALSSAAPGVRLHGRLFGPGPAEFANGAPVYTGNLSGLPHLRDYRPEQFLARLIWIDRDRPIAFLLHVGDTPRIRTMLARDRHASAVLIAPGAGRNALLKALRDRQPNPPEGRSAARYLFIDRDRLASDLLCDTPLDGDAPAGDRPPGPSVQRIARFIQGEEP